jgi:hypothetical protein
LRTAAGPYIWVEEGQKPLDVALTFFEKPLRFRGLQAEEDDVALRLDDTDLASAARQIRELHAAAGHEQQAVSGARNRPI